MRVREALGGRSSRFILRRAAKGVLIEPYCIESWSKPDAILIKALDDGILNVLQSPDEEPYTIDKAGQW